MQKIQETILNCLTPDDVYVLCEMIDEFNRVGDFDIAFPTADSMANYFRYFEQPRYYNLLVCQFLKKFNTEAKLDQGNYSAKGSADFSQEYRSLKAGSFN